MFIIPPASEQFLQNIELDDAASIAAGFVNQVQAADTGSAHRDPSGLQAVWSLGGRAVLWSAKLAVDADGVNGKELDPDNGQNDTSWHFRDTAGNKLGPLDSRIHPYYVLPLGGFREQVKLNLGDIGVCIYRNQLTGFLFGDLGPHDKIGEGSIALHDGLRPAAPDCCHRDADANPTRIIDVSIERNVVVMGFPGSLENFPPGVLTPHNFAELVKAKAYELFAAMKGGLLA